MGIFEEEKHNILEQLRVLEAIPEDPVADKTGWYKIISGNTRFFKFRVVQTQKKRLEVKKSKYVDVLALCLGFSGIIAFIGFMLMDQSMYIHYIFSFVPLIAGSVLFFYAKEFVFDKKYKYFWRGKKNIGQLQRKEREKLIHLDSIYAVQILSKEFTSSNDNRKEFSYNFEINLVLDSGKRINLMDDSDRVHIEKSARAIATFLDIPLWNGIL